MYENNATTVSTVHHGLTTDPAQVIAELEAMRQELAEYKKRERIENENRAMADRMRREPRFLPTRNTLVLRRTPKHDIIAPARDVFSYIEIYDMKDAKKKENTKVRVSEEEIKTYQALVAEGVQSITPELIKNIIEGKGGKVDDEEAADQEAAI